MIPLLVEEKILEGERLESEDAVELFERAEVSELEDLLAHAPRHELEEQSAAADSIPLDLTNRLKEFEEAAIPADLASRLAELVELYRTVHSQGSSTLAILFYGYGESYSELVEQMALLRELQDQTGRFKSLRLRPCSAVVPEEEYKVNSISRLFFDNLPSEICSESSTPNCTQSCAQNDGAVELVDR
jgi:2-iminoacetate synthase ThiH